MALNVGINGFGRIGRIIFRTCLQNPCLKVSAINDPAVDVDYICYLIKFDSTHGKFNGTVERSGNEITIHGHKIIIFKEKLPTNIPWQVADVQYVVEASGMFTNLEKASGHLTSEGVKRVLVTAPSLDVPMVVLGVNDDKLGAGHKVISCASSTLYCLAPIIKILEDAFGVSEGFVTSIHAMTPSLKPLDGLCLKGKHWRDHRSIHQNIIPAATGACRALGRILPPVRDRLTGLAFRVPIVNVSVLDITIRLKSNTSIEGIVRQVENAANGNMKNIIRVSKEQAVSSDFAGDTFSCILDLDSSMQLTPDFFKLICWYENEYSYACRIVDSIFFLERQYQLEWTSKMSYIRPTPKQSLIQAKESYNKFTYHQACSYECHNSKSFRSSSQDSGFKSPKRQSITKKPSRNFEPKKLSYLNRENKKNNELFKIWKDEDEIVKEPIRQNRSSLFHSCVALTPPFNTNASIKTREKLENVKREFSKMVIMTENLLKQSNHSKIKIGSPEISSNDLINTTCEKVSDSDEFTFSIHKALYYKHGIKAIDNNSKVDTQDNKFSEVKHCYETTTEVQNDNIKDVEVDHNNPTLIEDDIKNNEHNSALHGDIPNNEHNNETYDTQTRNDKRTYSYEKLKDKILNFGLTLTNENEDAKKCALGNGYNTKHVLKSLNSKNFKPTDTITTASNNDSMSEETTNCSSAACDQGETESVENDKYLRNKPLKQEPNTSFVILKQSELIRSELVNANDNNATEEIDSNKCEVENSEREDQQGRNLQVRLQGVLKKLAIDSNVSEKPSTCLSSNTITTASNRDIKPKQDIYDKLDSVSATDSENSFHMKERKSQVINITDLTNSLEDLDRLDKICRIMEISDELSNQLLSPLNSNDYKEIKNKKWSFKDLCERIKLDEFCEKLFNKSNC